MTLQQHLDRLASLDAIMLQAKLSLNKDEYEAYLSALPAMERFLSYVNRRVRRMILETLLKKQDVALLPDGTPSELRNKLVLLILDHGKQDVLANFALKYMFHDTSIQQWAHEHDFVYMQWTRPAPGGDLDFISFDRAQHEEVAR